MSSVIPQSSDPSVRYMDTAQAYDLWAKVYDTDGNFLQALDTHEMKKLMPRLLDILQQDPERLPKPWKFVDLGCGTGRNTAALLTVPDVDEVVGLDVSSGMLQVAEQRLKKVNGTENLRFDVFDMLKQDSPPDFATQADAVVSTLVIEHVPADIFFKHAAKLLKPGGLLLLTNMHGDMGKISQAGFIDPDTGVKIRPTSYGHSIEEIETAAKVEGFDVVGGIEERAVDKLMLSALGSRSEKWLGVTVWFGGIFCLES
jgi:SAM-dependent methyltransferase